MGVPFSACLPRARCTALACLALLHGAAAAQTPPAGIEYKFTPTHLHSSDGNHALDLNLRAGSGPHIGWVGIYRDRQGYQQARLGYEYRMEIDGARIAWSLQYAQRGFVGASVTAEVGGETFAIVGADRNNLRDYYNLNFDPGNATVLGIGTRAVDKTDLSLFQVRDYRLHNQQQITHAVARWRPAPGQRLTIDISYKSGQGATGRIRGTGLAVGYDYGDYFVKVVRDPYANFSAARQTRVAAGLRF